MIRQQVIAIHLVANTNIVRTRQNICYWHGTAHITAVYARPEEGRLGILLKTDHTKDMTERYVLPLCLSNRAKDPVTTGNLHLILLFPEETATITMAFHGCNDGARRHLDKILISNFDRAIYRIAVYLHLPIFRI